METSGFDSAGEAFDILVVSRPSLLVLKNFWRTNAENQKILDRIPSTFGQAELVFLPAPAGSCIDLETIKTVVFLACSDFTIDKKMWSTLQFFFERDKAEALVFEYNPFEDIFQCCRTDQLQKRVF